MTLSALPRIDNSAIHKYITIRHVFAAFGGEQLRWKKWRALWVSHNMNVTSVCGYDGYVSITSQETVRKVAYLQKLPPGGPHIILCFQLQKLGIKSITHIESFYGLW